MVGGGVVLLQAIPTLDQPPPPWPRWVAPLLGKPLHAVYPRQGACIGNTDGILIDWTDFSDLSQVVPSSSPPMRR